ncbi:MAG: M28 family peptidase [Deltaproteobacteria bacterium]|nr:M28 family peptidase [Deltaproteobacteria bacterium]
MIKEILDEISADRAHEHIVNITKKVPQRLAGSPELKWMAHYVRDAMEAVGVPATVYDLDALVSFPGEASLKLLTPETRDFRCLPFCHIRSTDEKGIEGDLVFVGAGTEKDYEGKDVRGKITLSELSYSPPRQEKERIGSARGAIGHVMMNWGPSDCEIIAYGSVKAVWGNPTPETIKNMPSTPCLTVSRATGEYLRDLCKRGPVRVRMSAHSPEEWRTTQITVGRLEGSEEPDKAILIGGHMDAWGGGVSCNAIGNSGVLELARAFAKHRDKVKRSVWFTLWSGHETGTMTGSTWFCDHFWDELDRKALTYINVDSPGLVGATEYNTRSSSELLRFHKEVEAKLLPGVHCRRVRLTRIGDMSFVGLGVPTLSPRMAYSEEQVKAWNGADLGPWHHSIEMTLDTVDMKVLQKDLAVYVGLVGRLSNEPVLPYDFTPVGQEMVKRLDELADKAPKEFGLGELQDRARRFDSLAKDLEKRVQALREKEGWPLSPKVLSTNRSLMRLSRALNAPGSAINGKWDQDLYGLTTLRTVFPSLYPVEELSRMDPEALETRLLRTRLIRNRNWIADCLKEAVETADAAVGALE